MRLAALAATLAAIFVAAAGPAASQSPAGVSTLKSSVTAAELQTLLDGAGLPSEMVDSGGTGLAALSRFGDVEFTVRALNCKGAPSACSTLMFYANFDLGRPAGSADVEAINRFNDGEVFGRAYLRRDRNEVGVDYVVELDGGVTPEHLSKNLARWRKVVSEFLARLRATPNS